MGTDSDKISTSNQLHWDTGQVPESRHCSRDSSAWKYRIVQIFLWICLVWMFGWKCYGAYYIEGQLFWWVFSLFMLCRVYCQPLALQIKSGIMFPHVLLHSCLTPPQSASGLNVATTSRVRIMMQDTPPGGHGLQKRTPSSECWYDLVLVPRWWPALWKAQITVKFCLSPSYLF